MPFWQKPVLKLLLCVKRLKRTSSPRDEAQRIVTDARKSAQDQADAILAEARAEAAALREKAEADIVSEKKKAVNEIKDEISDIAILIAEKVVEKEITPADHEKLIAQFIDRVGE